MANIFKEFRNDIVKATRIPLLFLALCWVVFVVELFLPFSFHSFGVKSLSIQGLRGVFFMPFLHGDIEHILNNTIGIFTLGTLLFFSYKEIALKIFVLVFLISGLWTWSIPSSGYHIGASAIIYGLFGFLTLSGILRKEMRLLAITFLVIFLHQGIVWGIFPGKPGISWQGHLAGFLSGIVLAIYFRKDGPQRVKRIINDDDSFNELRYGKYYWDEEKRKEEIAKQQANEEFRFVYFYKKEEDESH
ncbi:MAG: rhomboid family intramembrane serine protease [Flavobacteriales bacterium]